MPRLRGASSSVRKDESAPVQCILRIGCPRGGLRSGVVRCNAGESTDTWTKAQKCVKEKRLPPMRGTCSPAWTRCGHAGTRNAGGCSGREASTTPTRSTADATNATGRATASASGSTGILTCMEGAAGRRPTAPAGAWRPSAAVCYGFSSAFSPSGGTRAPRGGSPGFWRGPSRRAVAHAAAGTPCSSSKAS